MDSMTRHTSSFKEQRPADGQNENGDIGPITIKEVNSGNYLN